MDHDHILNRIIPESFRNPFQQVMSELLNQPIVLSGNQLVVLSGADNACNEPDNTE